MTKFPQIVLVIVAVLWFEAKGIPIFQGVSFQRGFEINFKPLPRNPITFLKEKWSPFGVFGRKHSIQKRNSGSGMVTVGQPSPVVTLASRVPEPRPAAPVFEHVEETEHLHTSPLITLPLQTPRSVIPIITPVPPSLAFPISPQVISPGPALVSSPAPSLKPLSVMPPPPTTFDVVNIIPNKPSGVLLPTPPVPLEGGIPPISTNMVITPPPGRFTDISRAEPVREYMNTIQSIPPPLAIEEKVTPPLETNSIKPEPPKNDIVITDNSLIRGSKLALYFGGIFLQLMSQFLNNARATFDQMTNPPPIYNN